MSQVKLPRQREENEPRSINTREVESPEVTQCPTSSSNKKSGQVGNGQPKSGPSNTDMGQNGKEPDASKHAAKTKAQKIQEGLERTIR